MDHVVHEKPAGSTPHSINDFSKSPSIRRPRWIMYEHGRKGELIGKGVAGKGVNGTNLLMLLLWWLLTHVQLWM